MSETPDDAPSISGPAPPNTWTLGYAEEAPGGMKCVAERSLSDGEYERYHEAVSFVLDRKDQASLKLVIGNYGEFRAIQSSMAIIFTTTKQANWPDPQDSLFHLCRILLNWLNSIRLFDDHNRARIVRTYGDPSPELDAFMAANAPADLTDGKKKAFRAALEPLAGAKSVKVQQVDRFGDKVYRASLGVTADGRERTVFFLLVESGEQLLWAGPN